MTGKFVFILFSLWMVLARASAIPFDSPCSGDAAKAAVAAEARNIITKMPISEIDSGTEIKISVPAPAKMELKTTVNNTVDAKDFVYSVGLAGNAQPFYTVVVRDMGKKNCRVIGVDADKK